MDRIKKILLTTSISLFFAGFIFVPINSQARTLNSYVQRPVLAVLGDSISSYYTYDAWSYYGPEGSPIAYHMNEAGMWWSQCAVDGKYMLGYPRGLCMATVTGDDTYWLSLNNPDNINYLGRAGYPDIIAVYAGTNDVPADTNDPLFWAKYYTLSDKLHSMYSDVKLILIAPNYFGYDGGFNQYIDLFADDIRSVASIKKDYYVDLRGVYSVTDDTVDGVHPNESGMVKIAGAVTDSVARQMGAPDIDAIRAVHDYDHYVIKISAHSSDYDNLRFRFRLTDDASGEEIYNTDWTYDNCYELYDINPYTSYTVYAQIDSDGNGIADASKVKTFSGLQAKTTGTAVYNGVDYKAVYNFNYYVEHNADMYDIFRNNPDGAIEHFVNCGMREGRQASADFNVWTYGSNNADLSAAFWLDMPQYYLHYINYGIYEGRVAV